MIQQEYTYFKDNQKALAKRFPDMYLVIKDRCVKFAVKTLAEAIDKAKDQGLVEGT